jgi:hypothetical protein
MRAHAVRRMIPSMPLLAWPARRATMPRPSDAPPLTIRLAAPTDVVALVHLAQLDASRPPRGLVLVAERSGRLLAALSLDDQHAVADPRAPTGEIVWLLAQRARELRRAERGRLGTLERVWPAWPPDEPDDDA